MRTAGTSITAQSTRGPREFPFSPTSNWMGQASMGRLHSPEALRAGGRDSFDSFATLFETDRKQLLVHEPDLGAESQDGRASRFGRVWVGIGRAHRSQ